MDIKKYSEEVIAQIDAMSNEEFNNLLKECGIDSCPHYTSMIASRMESVYSKYPRVGKYDINPKIFTPDIQELIRLSLEDED